MEVTSGSSGFPEEADPRWLGTLSVPSVVHEKILKGSVGPSLLAGSSLTAVSGRPLLVDGSRSSTPFVMAPPEQSLFSNLSLHGWDAHLGDSCLGGVVSTGAEVSYQPLGDDGCFPGSAVLSAGSLGHSGVSHVKQLDSGGLFEELGGHLLRVSLGSGGRHSPMMQGQLGLSSPQVCAGMAHCSGRCPQS
ncbi:hypothetical protein E2C01_052976 [Portunus trituberculatus]|uniref:Uncharacterized protein n=1 Tax=Portunus trituberculatus TaxID=210409 RepID=A0A5B7GFX9_PORTR|nr:hypothetical protein [Portunus trituberculatus]